MMKLTSILILVALMISCSSEDRNNRLLKSAGNPKSEVKAILFYTTGSVSVFSFNVSIVSDDQELLDSDIANVFSYTWSDTSKVDLDTLVRISWESPNELVIHHPEKGTVWKNEESIEIHGGKYNVMYQIK